MRLAELVETSRRLAATRKRLEKVRLLAELLQRMDAATLAIGVGFLTGQPRQGRIGIGWATLREAADTGTAAAESTLDVTSIDAALERLAVLAGEGSAGLRQQQVRALFAQATAEEREFLVRLLLGELRQGALDGIMIEAIARATDLAPAAVRRAFMLAPDLGEVARRARASGAAGLAALAIRPLHPVQPMLAQTARDVDDALARLGRAGFEWKLDGARIQAHKQGDRVCFYTRGLNDVTPAVPELAEALRALPAAELILDGEAIALRPDGRPQPFQITMSRFGRTLDIEAQRARLPLHAFYFDCLHADGVTLAAAPAVERLAVLERSVPAVMRVPRLVTDDAVAARAFVADALARGHEGVVVKALDAPYAAGARGAAWLKLKPAHTLDLVVLAVEWGSGRRHGLLSNLHLGARDPASGGFVMLGKTFKGMTDAMLAWQTEHLLALQTQRAGRVVHVRPELIVEVAFDGVQRSTQYPGGVALRFARVKGYRTDKPAAEADTIETVRALYAAKNG
jgi:DNA ligase-1